MIEDNVDIPCAIVVALFAIDAQLLVVDVVGLVTRYAGGGDIRVGSAGCVAIFALGRLVFASQDKAGLLCVIECGGRPIVRAVALLAHDSERAFVIVVFLMTGQAVHLESDLGRRLDVAIFAARIDMLAEKRKFRLGVIELRDIPIVHRMARRAVLAQPGFVHILVAVA